VVASDRLQLRVIAFKVAGIEVVGAAPENYPPSRIRLVPGQQIDARKLETDLDWANRNPFRQVEAVLSLKSEVSMLASSKPLPDTDRLAARTLIDGLHRRAGSWRVSVQASISY